MTEVPERNTRQKSIIYDTLCCLDNHPTADCVYEAVHERYPAISRAKVYRVLNRFADNGVIQKVGVNRGADHFDHRVHPHYHICCTRCGRMSDVELPYMAELERRVGDCRGYRITGCSVQFDGVCPECQRSEEVGSVR